MRKSFKGSNPWIRGLRGLLGRMRAHPGSGADLVRELAEHSADVICCVGPDRRFTYVSPSARRLFGTAPEEMVGTSSLAMIIEEDLAAVIAGAEQLERGETDVATCQVRVRCADGRLIWVESSARLLSSGAGVVLVLRDITQRKLLEQGLAELALRDGLTGLANRRAFDEALDREWRRTVADGTQMALLLLDVDNFKRFNDRYGHQAGDDCLRAVASAVQGSVRQPGDIVGRYGGEEFGIILCNTEAEAAAAMAESIRAQVEALQIPHEGSDCASLVTVSIGVATALARTGGTVRMPEGLVQAADSALYRAKRDGRNRIETALLFAPTERRSAG